MPRRPGRPRNQAVRVRRREQILEAATRMFAARGYSATTTEALAEELRVGKGTIYRYFPTKRAVFLAALDRVMRQLHLAINAAIAGVEEPFARISRGIHGYLAFFAQRPEYVELLVQERAQFKDRKQPTYFEHRDVNVGRWRELFQQLMASGRVRPLPVERLTDVIGDLLFGTMFTNYFTRRSRSPQVQAEDILEVLLRGILSEAERRRQARRAAACAKVACGAAADYNGQP